MSSVLNSKNLLWLALVATPLFTAGCPVDVNDELRPPPDPVVECVADERATIRFFHAAAGTPVVRPEFLPASTPNLVITRPDYLVPSAADPTVMVPQQVTSLAFGRGVVLRVCGNKELTFDLKVAGAPAARVTQKFTFVPDLMSEDDTPTLIFAGIADTLVPSAADPNVLVPENPASVADPLRIIRVTQTFSASNAPELIVVHASTRLGDITVKTASVEEPPAVPVTSESAVVSRYSVSPPLAIKGTDDGVDPAPGDTAPVPVTLTVNEVATATAKARFTINPRFPDEAKGIVVLFDRIVFDPDMPADEELEAPTRRLFLTSDDPLLGSVPGGGITLVSPI